MSYKAYFTQKVEKYKTFFEDKSPGQILALICPYTFDLDYTQWGIEDRPLNSWDFGTQTREFMEYQVRRLRCFLEYTRELDNDYMPSVNGSLGIGMNSAYFSGADIVIGEDTSWIHPVIHEWEDLYSLKLDQGNKWFRLLQQMTAYSVELCEGDYAPATFTHFAPFDMANALRGNQLFYDFYDHPEKVHELMNISADAIIWLEMELRKLVKSVLGGTVSGSMWFPGEAPFMSEDATDLCSAQLFKEFGFPYTQKVIDALGGTYIHHHAKGMHVHGEIAKLKGLKTLEISWDPNCPRPIEHLPEIYEWNGDVPLQTRCTAADVYKYIDDIKRGRIVLMLNVNSLEEAGEVVRFIRKHSKI
jgi:hypothetical protein